MVNSKRNTAIFLIMGIVLTVLCFLSLRFGSSKMTFTQFANALLMRSQSHTESIIIYNIRVPRILAGITAGAGMAVSGVLLQGITDNKMASPNLIGVNSGAGFAVILALSIFSVKNVWLPLVAFLGALGASFVIITLSARLNVTKNSVVLIGIAFSSVLTSGISLLSLIDTDVLVNYNAFSIGSLAGVKTENLYIPAVIVIVCFVFSVFLAGNINMLILGDGTATALGVQVKAVRIICMIIASAASAAVVSYAGLLGFVGLMAPHIARQFFGADVKKVLPGSVLCGAILVVSADFLGRVIFAPSEIPVGILMAVLGAPFFLGMVLKRGGTTANA